MKLRSAEATRARTRVPRRVRLAAAAVCLSAAGSLTLVEFVLRKLEHHSAPVADYGDVFDGALSAGGQLRPEFDALVSDGLGGLVRWKTNSDGFRNDREFDRKRIRGGLRILSLGDSFAAGYRVGQEETYSRRLERKFSETFGPAEVMLAVVDDSLKALEYLRKDGLTFAPDLVILAITVGNDFAQAYAGRHPTPIGFTKGLDTLRLPSNAIDEAHGIARLNLRLLRWLRTLALHQRFFDPPGIASWYGRFDKRMLFDPANGLGMYLREPPAEILEAYARLFAVLRDLDDELRKGDVGLVLLVVPQRFEVQPEDWRATVRDYELRDSAFDLGRPGSDLAAFAQRQGLSLIDPTESMRIRHQTIGVPLYLPRRDMHWNARGHEAFANGIYPALYTLISGSVDDH